MPNEADTCRRYVVPKLQVAGWEDEPHRIHEQVTFTDGRIVVTGRRGRRRPGKRADYVLRYRPDIPIGHAPVSLNAGRNPKQFLDYILPLPTRPVQERLVEVRRHSARIKNEQHKMIAELEAMMPAILDRAFKGEL